MLKDANGNALAIAPDFSSYYTNAYAGAQ
jgi:hypothetical protein